MQIPNKIKMVAVCKDRRRGKRPTATARPGRIFNHETHSAAPPQPNDGKRMKGTRIKQFLNPFACLPFVCRKFARTNKIFTDSNTNTRKEIGRKARTTDIFVDCGNKTNQAPFRSDIIGDADGIQRQSAKPPRRNRIFFITKPGNQESAERFHGFRASLRNCFWSRRCAFASLR